MREYTIDEILAWAMSNQVDLNGLAEGTRIKRTRVGQLRHAALRALGGRTIKIDDVDFNITGWAPLKDRQIALVLAQKPELNG
jgi:hypothetical protein